ncbi:MAG: NAD-dependent deacylase [Bacteroidia bacterium]|nr:NAD-dependent deacylase [Bacteroidia bacterium]MCX7651465.1 NAD-dependent deacylase [Bacteroidia bacterium]MDW8416780.1 Sir2 family NAD-dependent protein deacetylase [Bacteroidia bacterium]
MERVPPWPAWLQSPPTYEPGRLLVILTGAGISAESGLSTFRDSGGLWEKYSIYEVATPEAWHRNPQLVLDFYNARRAQLASVLPNPAHLLLRELEKYYTVILITQNVDDLHERAGSSYILHLHGELTKARSTIDDNLIYHIGYSSIRLGDTCEKGAQLRPHVVWFGEEVPAYGIAQRWSERADIFVVIGSSLQVYPAAGLLDEAYRAKRKFLIDPKPTITQGVETIAAPASEGTKRLLELLI